MSKYFILVIAVFCSLSVFAESTEWDCSKISLKKFEFAKDCARNSKESTNDPKNKYTKVNRDCSITVDIAGKEKTLIFLTPSPSEQDDIGFTIECEKSRGLSWAQLPDGCVVSLYQGSEEPVNPSCSCSNIGCGQGLVRVKRNNLSQITEKLSAAVKALDAKCDDLSL